MCLTIPCKIIKINKNQAEIKQAQGLSKVDISLVSDIKVGDYVLEQSGFAIKKLSKKQAKEILNLLTQHNYDK